jgi:hypothetical protein
VFGFLILFKTTTFELPRLGGTGDLRVIKPLYEAFGDINEKVRLAAAYSLDNLNWQFAGSLTLARRNDKAASGICSLRPPFLATLFTVVPTAGASKQ